MNKDTIRKREKQTGWFLIIPALLILALVFIYPIGRAFWLSLFTQNIDPEVNFNQEGIKLAVNPHRIHWFDLNTGDRLVAS
jgi:multiple sugar transport system permease protein